MSLFLRDKATDIGIPIGIVKGGPYGRQVVTLGDTAIYDQKTDARTLLSVDISHYNGYMTDPTDGYIQHMPKMEGRECLYVAGPSGSGKSTYIANYARMYQLMFPGREIYLFSRLPKDAVIDQLRPIRVVMDSSLIDNPIEPEELANSLVIFDDTDTIPDDKIKNAVLKLKNDLLEIGRHENISVAISSHKICDRNQTKTALNEAHTVTIFPQGGGAKDIVYLLQEYFGMPKRDVNAILRLPSRWVTLFKNYPQAVMYNRGAYVLA